MSTDYWPLVLYDAREARPRDNALPNNANDAASNHPEITAEGVMDYIELDVNNLSRWFTGAIGANGTKADNVGGFSVYFSDRRGNQTDPTAGFGVKTGAFGFNDIVNGTSDPANGCPNGALDAGEDLEGDGKLRTYGGLPLTAVEQTALGTPTLGIYNLEANLSGTNLVSPVADLRKEPELRHAASRAAVADLRLTSTTRKPEKTRRSSSAGLSNSSTAQHSIWEPAAMAPLRIPRAD